MTAFAPGAVELELDDIIPNKLNVRLHIDEQDLRPLAQSIRAEGLIQPIVVRPADRSGQYQLVCGERRWRAMRLLHTESGPEFGKITARIMRGDDDAVLALMHAENMQRDNWTAFEKALFYKQAYESKAFSSLRTTARALGLGTTTMHRYLKIFELPKHLVDRFAKGQLGMAEMEIFAEASPDQYKHLLKGFEQGWSKNDARKWLRGESFQADSNKALRDKLAQQGIRSQQRKGRISLSIEAKDLASAIAMLRRTIES